jgi:glycogen debranching enzyme
MQLPLADGRSYGGFDETFLFVLAHDAFVRFHPDHVVDEELWPNVERALDWIDTDGDPDGDGLYEYARRNPANLLNEVWKDSFDAATHTGFDVPPQPLAWLEVQAYARSVMLAAARGHRKRANTAAAQSCEAKAQRIDELIDRRFWLGDADGYAMALDGHKQPVRFVASNPGHALWAGAVRPERVAPLVARMTRPDLLSPYGLRTLSAQSPYYAPFAYHRGAVWPFDNAIFAIGLLRAGYLPEAVRVASSVGEGLLRAGSAVECYAVLDPEHFVDERAHEASLCWRHVPVRNRVQAFSAAALVAFGAILEVAG